MLYTVYNEFGCPHSLTINRQSDGLFFPLRLTDPYVTGSTYYDV